jgi:hypothetical protein
LIVPQQFQGIATRRCVHVSSHLCPHDKAKLTLPLTYDLRLNYNARAVGHKVANKTRQPNYKATEGERRLQLPLGFRPLSVTNAHREGSNCGDDTENNAD